VLFSRMLSKTIFWLMLAGALSVLAKDAPRMAPVPADPLELVTGQIQAADTPASRGAVVQLLSSARDSYAFRSAGHGYDLKVSFTVNSGGQTEYDGAWAMEDIFDPQLGLRWTAQAEGGYSTTQISSNGMFYGTGTASTFPLRLQEARAALFDPIPAAGFINGDSLRTSASTFHGEQVTCVLLSGPQSGVATTSGRSWEETEECIDPQSGLLRVHSQVPGRYYSYEYSNALQLGGHMVPRKVIVTEGGKTVSEISVDSLVEMPSADPSLFVPSDAMKAAAGPSTAMGEAQKIWRYAGRGPFTARVTAHPVCVFGLVTPSGQLTEAHSLQPSDPNSQVAVEAAKRMNFFYPTPPGARPQQHFVFVIEKFVASQ
jgi:hypothetical protein